MGRHTAEDLARLAGLTPRTVRYYVAEKLIDPPLGRGRGAHFDDRHLAQLRRVRLLQASGLDLPGIRAHLAELREVLASRGLRLDEMEVAWSRQAEQVAAAWAKPAEVQPERITRIVISPGLELLVTDEFRLPPPAKLAELASTIARAFQRRGSPNAAGPRATATPE
jgi:DNA-binding transcriptional MerR regulator